MRLALLLALGFAVGVLCFNALTFGLAFRRPPRPRRMWAALAKELLGALLLLPLWPLWRLIGRSYPARRGGAGAGRPVVLLHGYAMNRTNWFWLARRLARRGIGPLHGADYRTRDPVELSARHFRDYVERLRARTGAERVDVVAHSLGGLVARYFIEHLGGATQVGALVTIATPHRGTALGRLGLGLSARDLQAGSALLGELGTVRRPHDVAYTSIWSTCDNVVVPAESSRLGAAGEDVVFDDLGHLSLLISPRVADAVAARLR